MDTKLTLLVDDKAIRRAKREARQRGTSVSRMVEDYFLGIGVEGGKQPLPPLTASLYGLLKSRRVSDSGRKEYRKHLEEKHR